MIEVMVAALIVALAAAAVFSGFSSVANIAASQRHEAQANSLAEQDAQRLRALSVAELTSTEPSESSCPALASGQTFGNACYTQTIDGQIYTITSTSKFVAASGGTASCTTSGLTAADYVETGSSVTWTNNSGRPPVVVHSVISPHPGGALVIQTQNPSNGSLPGVTINVQGPSPSTSIQALTTDSSGCVVFGGLEGGNYTVSWPGYVNQNSVPSASITVVDGLTQTDTYQLSQSGAIRAQFTTTFNGQTSAAGTGDTFIASNSSLSSPLQEGTVNAFTSPTTTPSTLFPFSNPYSVYAGYCSGDAPPSPQAALVTAGGTTTVTVPEPAMIVNPQNSGGQYNDVNPSANVGNGDTNDSDFSWNPNANTAITYVGSWSHVLTGFGDYYNDETYASSTSAYVTVTFTGTSIEWLTSIYNNHGNATVTLYNGTGTGGSAAQAANTYSDYSSYTQAPVGLYNSGPLAYGTYTLKIAPTGTEPSGSGGTNVSIDGFIIGTNTTTEYNQSNGGTLNYTSGTTTVAYTGTWAYQGNATSGSTPGDGASAGDYSRDEAFSSNTGDKVAVTFTGTSIAWISKLYSNHGNATIQLKNSGGTVVQSGTYSDYDGDTEYQAAPYSSGPLAYGTYTLTITVAGTEPSGANGTYLTMDGFIIGTGVPSLTTISPHVVITDNNAGCSGHQTTPPAQVPTNANVGALVNPAEPYGNFTVCVDDGSVANSATLANTSFTQGNIVNVNLTAGASGVTAGTCSSPAVSSPYSSYSSTAAYMSEATNSFTIDAAGADAWLGGGENFDQYGAIYLPGGSVSSSTTTVEVNTQQNTNTWAKAGIMLRDSIAGSPTSLGYAVLAVTPGNGIQLQWDNSSSGEINQLTGIGSTTAPVWLQLIRSGSSITGRYSTDDSTWTTVGAATLTGSTTNEDVGMFSVSHNAGVLGVATFSNFSNA